MGRIVRSWKPLVFLGVLLSIQAVYGQAGLEGLPIGEIEIAGNVVAGRSQILARVRSRLGQPFDHQTAEQDASRIAELRPIVFSYYNTAIENDEVVLTFVVVERNVIRSIELTGNRKIRGSTLRKKLPFELGDYLDLILMRTGKENIEKHYQEKGYPFAEVRFDTEAAEKGEVVYIIEEGPRSKITSVRFAGNQAIESGELAKVIDTQKRSWLIFQQYFNRERLAQDVIKLQRAYQEEGFLDAKIEAVPNFSGDRSKVKVVFNIEEGPRYSIRDVRINGNEFFSDAELFEKIKFSAGDIFSPARARAVTGAVLQAYREIGFVEAEVETKRLFSSDQQVDLVLDIKEGERFRIGQVIITGNEQTQDKVIRRMLDEYSFTPGNWYDAHIAQGDGTGYLERLIQRRTYMDQVNIIPRGQQEEIRDAQVSVTEGQTGSIMVGAGIASDSGLIGQLVIDQRNFDWRDYPDSFDEFITGRAFRGAGQQLRVSLQPGTKYSEYSVSFTEPYFRDMPTSMNITGSAYQRYRESYTEKRLRGYLGFEQRLEQRWRRGVTFRLENVDVADIDFDAPQEIKDFAGDNFLAGAKFHLSRQLTDDPFLPTRGTEFEVAYEQVTGDYNFGIISGTYQNYFPLAEDLAGRRTVLSNKLHASAVAGNAPPFEKFYAGGQGSIRGFSFRGVSTRGLQTGVAPGTEIKKDPIGSDWLFQSNTEVIIPTYGETLSTLVFVDTAMIDTGGLRASVGAGIQFMIPRWFGPVPIRLELATPIRKDDLDETQVFSFSMGTLF